MVKRVDTIYENRLKSILLVPLNKEKENLVGISRLNPSKRMVVTLKHLENLINIKLNNSLFNLFITKTY